MELVKIKTSTDPRGAVEVSEILEPTNELLNKSLLTISESFNSLKESVTFSIFELEKMLLKDYSNKEDLNNLKLNIETVIESVKNDLKQSEISISKTIDDKIKDFIIIEDVNKSEESIKVIIESVKKEIVSKIELLKKQYITISEFDILKDYNVNNIQAINSEIFKISKKEYILSLFLSKGMLNFGEVLNIKNNRIIEETVNKPGCIYFDGTKLRLCTDNGWKNVKLETDEL